jgi:hypothetical protein
VEVDYIVIVLGSPVMEYSTQKAISYMYMYMYAFTISPRYLSTRVISTIMIPFLNCRHIEISTKVTKLILLIYNIPIIESQQGHIEALNTLLVTIIRLMPSPLHPRKEGIWTNAYRARVTASGMRIVTYFWCGIFRVRKHV